LQLQKKIIFQKGTEQFTIDFNLLNPISLHPDIVHLLYLFTRSKGHKVTMISILNSPFNPSFLDSYDTKIEDTMKKK